jgi:hypothetical protein
MLDDGNPTVPAANRAKSDTAIVDRIVALRVFLDIRGVLGNPSRPALELEDAA